MRVRLFALGQRQILWLALTLVAFLSCLNSLASPLFEPPDELQHYQFVRYLIDQRRLPIQTLEGEVSQSHQPPLYYLVGAFLVAAIDDPAEIPPRNPFWAYYLAGEVSRDNKQQFLNPDSQAFPYRGTAMVIHLLRLWSVALALGTVTATWLLGCTLWPEEPIKVAAMLSLSVLNPMFLYVSGTVNNDNLVILCGAVTLWLSVVALKNDFAWKTTLSIGLVWSCAMLTKITGIIAVVPWSVALASAAWKRRDARLLLSRLGAILGIALVPTGWWFVRNLRIYGDPLALQRVLDVWGSREQLDLAWIWNDLVYCWTTFWGRFAYGQVPLPSAIYWLFLALVAGAAAGFLIRLRGLARRRECSRRDWPIWLTLVAAAAAFSAGLLYYIIRNPTGANGRYAFPALPALGALLVHGTSALLRRQERSVLAGLALTACAISLFSLGLFLPWTYGRPELLSEKQMEARVQTQQDLRWDAGIGLAGTAVTPREVSPGQRVSVTACWRARAEMGEDYVFFVHLLDHQFKSLGQRDTYTGLGTYPTSFWRPGDLFCDTYRVPVSADISEPVVGEIEIGFYELESRHRLSVHASDGVPLERVVVGQVKVMPREPAPIPPMAQPADARFAQGVVLTGYNWSEPELQAGEVVSLTVAWGASGPLDRSYTVFAHLLDANGQLITQDDGLPRRGAYPTTFWGPGETIIDTRVFRIPKDTTPGPTGVLLGFYRLEDGVRLPRDPGSPLPDAARLPGPTLLITTKEGRLEFLPPLAAANTEGAIARFC
jgi:4-amino-4-deoxy-L-arabinose transferase-like glycosyltransferase